MVTILTDRRSTIFSPHMLPNKQIFLSPRDPALYKLRGTRKLARASSQFFSRAGGAGDPFNFQPASGSNTKMGISLWFRLDTLAADRGIISKINPATSPAVNSDGVFFIQCNSAGGAKLRVAIFSDPTIDFTVSGGLVIEHWYHLLMTFDGAGADDPAKLKMYLDGVQLTTPPGSTITRTQFQNPSSALSALQIGRDYTPNYSDMQVDDVAAWNDYTPTAADAAELFNQGFGRTYADLPFNLRSPIAYYRCDEASGNMLDATTNAYHLTAQASPTAGSWCYEWRDAFSQALTFYFGDTAAPGSGTGSVRGPIDFRRKRLREFQFMPDYWAVGSPAMMGFPASSGAAATSGSAAYCPIDNWFNSNLGSLWSNLKYEPTMSVAEDFDFISGDSTHSDGNRYWMTGILGPSNTSNAGLYNTQLRIHDAAVVNGEVSDLNHSTGGPTWTQYGGNSYFSSTGMDMSREFSQVIAGAEVGSNLQNVEIWVNGHKQTVSSFYANGAQNNWASRVTQRDYIGLHCFYGSLFLNISKKIAYGDIVAGITNNASQRGIMRKWLAGRKAA